MNSTSMRVRCLASTRVPEGSKQEKNEDDDMEQEGRREDDGVEDEENDLKRDEILEGPIHENEAGDDGNEISQSSLLSSNSASASDSDVQDSSDDASSIGSQQSIRHISCIQEAQLSPDGTCIFTADFARTFSVYPIDNGILSETGTCTLATYASFSSANPIWTFALNPLFNVQDASSTTVLVSRRDSYITLHNALWGATRAYDTEELRPSSTQPIDISKPLASYKLVNNLTEAVIAPLSLTYSNDGAHFFAGKQDGIAIFDFEDTDSPIHTIATIPAKRNKLKGGGRGFKGWISALSLSPPSISHSDGLLAAGARTRHVGIYDPVGGGEVTHFSLPGTINGKKNRNENLKHIMGDGVSSLKWSPCGKYLYVAERHSDVLLIYDVRNFSLSLGYCAGRKALTKQKLGFDIWNAGASPYDIEGISHEIWAGSTDGKMRVWRDPYRKEGAVEPDEVVQVGEEEAPVVGTLVHPSGSLAVAACGSVVLDDEMKSQGMRRGGGLRPKFREWGSLDILGLG